MNVPRKLGTLSPDGIVFDHALCPVTGEYRCALADEAEDLDVEVEAD